MRSFNLIGVLFVFILLVIINAQAQEPLVGDNPPPITITPADSVSDSTQSYLDAVNVTEVKLLDATRARTSSLTRKGERDALLTYWTAKAEYHAAQMAYFSYVGDKVSAYNARVLKIEALAKSYAYLPSEPTKIEHPKYKLDTQG